MTLYDWEPGRKIYLINFVPDHFICPLSSLLTKVECCRVQNALIMEVVVVPEENSLKRNETTSGYIISRFFLILLHCHGLWERYHEKCKTCLFFWLFGCDDVYLQIDREIA